MESTTDCDKYGSELIFAETNPDVKKGPKSMHFLYECIPGTEA